MKEFVESAPRGFSFELSDYDPGYHRLEEQIRFEICSRCNLKPFAIAIQEIQQNAGKSTDWLIPADKKSIVAILHVLYRIFHHYDCDKAKRSYDGFIQVPDEESDDELTLIRRCELKHSAWNVTTCIRSIIRQYETPEHWDAFGKLYDTIKRFGPTIDKFFEDERERIIAFERLLSGSDDYQFQINRLNSRIEELESQIMKLCKKMKIDDEDED